QVASPTVVTTPAPVSQPIPQPQQSNLKLVAFDGDPKKPYDNFGVYSIERYCLPILDHHFRILRTPGEPDRIYEVLNSNMEVALAVGDQPLVNVLHAGLKKLVGQSAPRSVINQSIELWKRDGQAITEDPAAFTFGDDYRLSFKHFEWVPTKGA